MTAPELLALGVVIGANNLAVAITLGALGQARRAVRIAAVFGVFEFTVPLVGLAIGRALAEDIGAAGRWTAPALMGILGLLAVRAAVSADHEQRGIVARATTLPGLVVLAAALSIDNLLVGFGLGARGAEPLLLASVIAVCSVTFALIGLHVGAGGRRHWERPAKGASGALLIALAIALAAGWVV